MTLNNSMDTGDTDQDNVESCWFIDLDWYQQHNRPFLSLARDYLCNKCREKLTGKIITVGKLLANIKSCCGRSEDFIGGELPITESIFRFFLANGNQPLSLNELGQQLSKLRNGDTLRTTPEILSHLLSNDQYYGFGVADKAD